MSRGERKAMITRDRPDLSLSRQCRLLTISRSSFYYAAKGESLDNLALMRRIDELFLKYPFYGSRQMVRQLRREGVCVGRHRVRCLMRLMGLAAIYQAPRTSAPHPAHRIYPYLLRGMAIDRPDSVWCADITYILQRGGSYIWSPSWTGRRARCLPGDCQTPWMPGSVLRLWKRRWRSTASQRYSIRIRAASSPASSSQVL